MTMNNTNITPDFDIIGLVKNKKLTYEEVGLFVVLFAISHKSLVLHNIIDLSKICNCGTNRIKGLIDKLIDKKLLIKSQINQRKYIYKIVSPDEDYNTVKMEFLKL